MLGQEWRIAFNNFCAVVKRTVIPSTAGQKRLVGETGELRKAALSVSLISVKFSHKALLITWAVVFVAHSSKFIALHSFLKAAGSGPDLSMERRSLAWKTYRTAY